MPGVSDVEAIRGAVLRKYATVAHSAEGKFQYPTGRDGALRLGYDPAMLAELPDEVLVAFCGVGNPFSLGPLKPGEAILDVGCGAGIDLIVASRLVGPRGRVCGIDMTPEMVECARANLARAGVLNGEVQVGRSEAIPHLSDTFDVVLSNGVLNLSPEKERTLEQIYRVLKPQGRLQVADIVLRGDLPIDVRNSLEAWSE